MYLYKDRAEQVRLKDRARAGAAERNCCIQQQLHQPQQ